MPYFVCRCGIAYRNLDCLLAHHATAHGTIVPHATATTGAAQYRRATRAIGRRRADDPYYAAREAARDPHDSDDFDREILAQRRAEQR